MAAMKRRDVLVTGAGGFVGKHVLERARARGVEAHAVRGDLRDSRVARLAVEEARPAAVIHLAAVRVAGRPDPWSILGDNLLLCANVLDAVRELAPEAPVLIAGSAAQYGMAAPHHLSEAATTRPFTAYGAIKQVLETACTAGPLRGPARVIWTRSFNHVGPGQGLDAPVSSWARQVAEAEVGGGGNLRTGRLDVERDFLDVRDIADAYLDLAASSADGVVNVCSGTAVRLQSIVEMLLRACEVPIAVERDPALDRPADPPHVVGDAALLRSLTGWRPRIDLEQSVADVLDEWRARVREAEPKASATRGA